MSSYLNAIEPQPMANDDFTAVRPVTFAMAADPRKGTASKRGQSEARTDVAAAPQPSIHPRVGERDALSVQRLHPHSRRSSGATAARDDVRPSVSDTHRR